jgi:hypothetical protein
MATNVYMTSRKQYQRPQAMLWANNPGTISGGLYVPNGFEIGQDVSGAVEGELLNEFLILSDDNRSPLEFQPLRLERRERMINGRMRSYHIADKLSISTSWAMLPSRSFSASPEFNSVGSPSLRESGARSPGNDESFEILPNSTSLAEKFTSDGGAGGVEILDWYNAHQDSFWVYLAYDKYSNFSDTDEDRYSRLGQYNQIIEMYISDFNYSVQKRGGSNYDFWNISVTLEEV